MLNCLCFWRQLGGRGCGGRAGSATACLASLSVTDLESKAHGAQVAWACGEGVPKLKHETYMCAFMYARMMPRVQMCPCMSARVLIEQMAFAHGTSAQPYTPVPQHTRVHNYVCVCVCLPATMPHLPLREEHWLLGHSSRSQADLPTSSARGPRDAAWIRESR